jgi:hypothetical protein
MLEAEGRTRDEQAMKETTPMEPTPPATGHRATVRWLALGLFLAYLITSSGGFESGDAVTRYDTARSWLAGRGGALTSKLAWNGASVAPDGRVFSYFGPLQSVLMVPFLLAARAVPKGRVDPSVIETFAISLGLFPLLSTAAMVLEFLSLRLLGYSPRTALAGTLGVALASMFWHYARMGQEENLLAFGFALWLYGAARLITAQPRASHRPSTVPAETGLPWPATLMATGAMVGLATRWASVPSLAALFVASVVLLHRYRRSVRLPDMALAGAVIGCCVAGLLWYNHARFGAWLETGYTAYNVHYHTTLFVFNGYREHFAALLVSPYRGLLIYSPIVLAAAAGLLVAPRGSPTRLLGVTAFATFGVLLLVLSAFHYWTAGHAWGPRFLTSPQVLLAPTLAALFARWPRSAAMLPALAFLQVFSTMLPESTEEYVWYNLDHARPGYCSEWQVDCTAVGQRIPRALDALANTFAKRPGVTLVGRPLVAPEVVLATSDYRTLYWWPVRTAFRLRALPLPAALLLCGAGLAAAAACLLAAWQSTRHVVA